MHARASAPGKLEPPPGGGVQPSQVGVGRETCARIQACLVLRCVAQGIATSMRSRHVHRAPALERRNRYAFGCSAPGLAAVACVRMCWDLG